MAEITEQTDEQIAGRVKKGDIQAFGILVERYEQKLLRYAKRFLFERDDDHDLVQEVFLKAYVNINGFDAERKFSSWIYRIAHNVFINNIRDKAKRPLSFFDPDTLFPHPVDPDQADTELKRQEIRALVEKYLNKLKAKYREPLVLYYYEDMDYKEIAEIMQLPLATVGVRIKRGRESLQKFYQDRTSAFEAPSPAKPEL